MAKIELIPYVPETASYIVYYPKHFELEETKDNIVTITSPEIDSNLTLTGYQASLDVDEKVLTDFFQQFTSSYLPQAEMIKDITVKRIFLEQGFKNDGINWIWWGIAEGNQIVLISANSDSIITYEDYNLYRFMIDQIEIYPSTFEE